MTESARPHVQPALTPPGAVVAALSPDLLALVERAAAFHLDGLALLEAAPLECAAVLLGVDARSLERARDALADPRVREGARAAFARAAAPRPAPAPAPAPAIAAPRDPEALLAAAAGRRGGLALLLSAAEECAAVLFGVHPDLVHRARELAAARGLPRDPSADA